MSIQHFEFQVKAKDEMISSLAIERGIHLSAMTGLGKTYMIALLIKEMLDREGGVEPINGSIHSPFLYIAPSSVVKQSQRVFKEFGLGPNQVICMSYANLRTKHYKKLYFNEEKYYVGMEEQIEYHWKPELFPRYVIVDEPQALRNTSAKITQLLASLLVESLETQFLNVGYTPFIKPGESWWICFSCGVKTVPGSHDKRLRLTHDKWKDWIWDTAGNPDELNASGVERIKRALDRSFVAVKGVRFKFKAKATQLVIPFATTAHREMYDAAWDDYMRELEILGKKVTENTALQKAIALGKLQKRAESIRAQYLAMAAKQSIENGRSPIIAIKYLDTVELLSFCFKQQNITASYIKGGQSMEERQQQLDDYQTGKTQVLVLTIGAGGTGLSAHHNPDNATTTHPRDLYMSPAFNAIEVAQTAGRPHRINSISNTFIYMLYFKDTVEEYVSHKLEKKLNCMSKMIAKGESWADLFIPEDKRIKGKKNIDDSGLMVGEKGDGDTEESLESGDFMDQEEDTRTLQIEMSV